MVEPHDLFTQPDNKKTKIWRYMDFTKFISLLDTKSLFFTRADKFDDPFEGSYPLKNVLARKHPPFGTPLTSGSPKTSPNYKIWPRYVAINCWHENEHESAAMWKLYLKSSEGIAIQSTFLKLIKSIRTKDDVYIGRVSYIDYEKAKLNEGNIFTPFIHKRKSFEHEKEIRAVIVKFPADKEEDSLDFSRVTIGDGLGIDVNLKILIQAIYVAPGTPKWFMELISSVTSVYGYNFKIIQSKMDDGPLF